MMSVLASDSSLRFRRPADARGTSPTKGRDRFSKSLRPRTLVFMFSRMNMMTTGIRMPRAMATKRMFFLTGAVGVELPVGGVMTLVL